jgi:hypothetical protein
VPKNFPNGKDVSAKMLLLPDNIWLILLAGTKYYRIYPVRQTYSFVYPSRRLFYFSWGGYNMTRYYKEGLCLDG